MDRDSIIGLALLIIAGIIAVNYLHVDCANIGQKGAEINPTVEQAGTGKPSKAPMIKQPEMRSAPLQVPQKGQDNEGPGISPPLPPPSPGPGGP